VLRLLRTLAPLGSRVVEIGCGTGGNLKAFSRDYEMTGCDVSPEAVERARARCPDVPVHLAGVPDDAALLGRDVKAFLLMDVLEHVDDDQALLAEVLGAMPVGAKLIITVPADPRLWSEHDVSFEHHRRYDMKSFTRLWLNRPVQCMLASYYNHRLYPVIRAVRWFNARRGRAGGLAGTDFTVPPTPVNRALFLVFAGEGLRLARAMKGRISGYPFGASLIAVLSKTA